MSFSNKSPRSNRKLLVLLPLLSVAIVSFSLVTAFYVERPAPPQATATRLTFARSTATSPPATLPATATAAPLVSAFTRTATPLPPTATATRVIANTNDPTATIRAQERKAEKATSQAEAAARLEKLARPQPNSRPPAGKMISHSRDSRLVLAHYFAWYDGDGWDDCNISAGDKPLQPYHSDDPAAIARHVQMAREIGVDGFLLHWFAPGGRTDRNFSTLLDQSTGTKFASSVVFSRHIWHGSPPPSQQTIAEALRHIIERHGSQPNFLRLDGKPVVFFTDVYRTPATGQTPQQFWSTVRERLDPQRQSWWIAEGLDPSYLNVFDGLYVFKISHAAYPHDYQKSPRWGAQVDSWEARTGRPKLWLATISPGWDDLRSGCKPDVRVDNTSHRMDRANGKLYRATFTAALKSDPDWLLVSSFNEWVEGSYIEPSLFYGDEYMRLTEEFVRRFKQQQ